MLLDTPPINSVVQEKQETSFKRSVRNEWKKLHKGAQKQRFRSSTPPNKNEFAFKTGVYKQMRIQEFFSFSALILIVQHECGVGKVILKVKQTKMFA